MTTPQPGIFVEGTEHHYLLEYRRGPDASRKSTAAALRASRDAAGPGANLVAVFGPKTWSWLAPNAVPALLKDFTPIDGPNDQHAPATQQDYFFWIHGDDISACFDAALHLNAAMRDVAQQTLDLRGFRYKDSRDLSGFVDGSANPKGKDRFPVALIPEGQPGAGGAYVLTQRWVHDLAAFRGLTVEEQERVIGRTKDDSIELEGDALPPNSHVARTDFKKDGVAYKLYRRSVPYGTVTEHGLYFLAFACDITRFDVLLSRMFGTYEDGVQDRLLEFSTPVTGSYWFAPSTEALAALLG